MKHSNACFMKLASQEVVETQKLRKTWYRQKERHKQVEYSSIDRGYKGQAQKSKGSLSKNV
jgi:hypothetical protein